VRGEAVERERCEAFRLGVGGARGDEARARVDAAEDGQAYKDKAA